MVTRNDETKPETIDAGRLNLPSEVIRRGFFQIVIHDPDFPPTITFDRTLLPEHVQSLIQNAKSTLQDANDYIVDSQEMYEAGARLRKTARDDEKTLEDFRTSITSRIDAVKEAVMEVFRGDKSLKDGPVPTLNLARQVLDQKLVAFEEAEERRRKEAERKEAERIENERKENERKAAELERETENKLADLRREAEQAAASGDDNALAQITEKARDIAEEADDQIVKLTDDSLLMHSAPVARVPLPRVAGFTSTTRRKCEVIDPKAFFQGIVDGKIPIAFGSWDQKKLDKQAELLGDEFSYPGCKLITKRGGSSR